MDKKAKQFVALLIKKFIDEKLPESEWNDIYNTAVGSLKGGRLKCELQQHSQTYQAELNRTLSAATKLAEESECQLRICSHKIARRLDTVKVDSPNFIKLTERLKKLERFSQELCPELRALCGLLCSTDDLKSLVHTMFVVLSSIQPDIETCLVTANVKRCCRLQKELKVVLVFIHLKKQLLATHAKLSAPPDPLKYGDVMASLLSFYVDLTLLITRSEDNQRDRSELCGFVSQLLAPGTDHIIDVLLQLLAMNESDVDIILPLARKCLMIPPEKADYKTYTKYIACAKSVVALPGDAAADITLTAESVKAPKNYLTWLRTHSPEIVENLPEDRQFKGRVITRFLMREADLDLMEPLLDILTEELPGSGETSEAPQPTNKAMEEDTSDTPLFFVDTKGGINKGSSERSLQNQQNDVVEVTAINQDDAVEVIEVDLSGFDLVRAEDDKRDDLDSDLDPSGDESEQSKDDEQSEGSEADLQLVKVEEDLIGISSDSEIENRVNISESQSSGQTQISSSTTKISSPVKSEQKKIRSPSPVKVTRMPTRSVSSVYSESSRTKSNISVFQNRNAVKSDNELTVPQESTRRRRSSGTTFCHFCPEPHTVNNCSGLKGSKEPTESGREEAISSAKKQKLETLIRKVSDKAKRRSVDETETRQSLGKSAAVRRKSLPSQLKRYNLRKKSGVINVSVL